MNISEKINQLQFQKYSAYLKSQGLSDATIKRKLSSLSSFQKFLIKKKFLVTQSTSPVLNPSVLRTAPNDLGAQFNPFKNFKFKIVNYVAIATVLILLSGLGYTVYSQTILQARKNLAYSTASNLTTPNRILSFQGRLTDSSGNPITSSTGIVFRLFNSGVGGTQLYVSDTGNSQTVVPDENGIFSVVIGKSHGLGIPSSVFSENAEVWLEITAGGETMDPRQQIATVGYALNAETLQGLPPSASGTKDTVLVIDGLGNINLGETSPSIISTSGTFGLEGQAVLIKASDTSGGNITINPDGAGILKLITEGSASPAVGGFIEATNANLATGNLFSGLIRNDNRSYNFIDFTNFDVGTTQLSTRFSVDASGTVTTSIGITAPKITLSVGASSGYILQSDANGNSTWVNPGSAGIGTSYDAGSGLTKTGSVFKFGGAITENTRLNIGSTEVLYINSANGRVGIGTTDTSYKVNIAGGDIALDNYRNIYWGSGATQSYLNVSSGFYRFYYNAVERLKFDLNASTTHSILDMTANLSLGTSATNTDLIFNPNRNAYMYSGNFGLGTTSPTYKLEVVGSNNIFRIGDTAGNTLFSVTDSAITSNLPTTFNSSGDVSMAYNLIFTNPTQSTIKSSAPLSIEAGEVFGSSNLSLKTYNSGNVIVDSQKLVIGGTLTYSQGAQNGYLLQSDANGNATWVTASGIGGTYTATNGLTLTGSSFGLGGTLTQNTNLTIGNTSALFINGTSGRIGIGTTSPSYNLDVNGYTNTSRSYLSGNAYLWGPASGAVAISSGGGAYGKIWVGDGAANSTTFGFGNYQNTVGMYSPGGQLAFSTNSTEALRIDLSGNVGIGTTTPNVKLEVLGSTGLRIASNASTYSTFVPGSNMQLDLHNQAKFIINNDGNLGSAIALQVWPNYAIGIGITSPLATIHAVGTGSSAIAIFEGSGNVGIGTTSPSRKLEVNGQIFSSATQSDTPSNTNGNFLGSAGYWQIRTGTDRRFALDLYNGGTWIEGLSVLTGGNVGIGTTNPSKKLDVAGDINLTGTIFSNGTSGTSGQVLTSTGTGLQWVNASSVGGTYVFSNGLTNNGTFVGLGGTLTQDTIINNGGFNLSIGTNNTSPSLYISSTNKVGIGTTNPVNTLQIGTSMGGYSNNDFAFGNINGASALHNAPGRSWWYANQAIQLYPGGNANSLYLATTGNVGIGTTSPSSLLSILSSTIDPTITIENKVVPGSSINNFLKVLNGSGTERLRFSYFQSQQGFGIAVGTSTSDPTFYINGLNNNVGIGTTAPSKKLDVVGDINLTGTIFSNGTSGTSGQVLSSTGTGLQWVNASSVGGTYTANNGITLTGSDFQLGGPLTQNTRLNIGNTEVMYIDYATGRIGLGTTAPSYNLDLSGTGSLRIGGNAGTGLYAYSTTPNHIWSITRQGANIDTAFSTYGGFGISTGKTGPDTNANYSLFVNNTGNVGIGTTNPQAKLHVKGDIFTDQYLSNSTNTFLGISAAGVGLTHTAGQEGWYNTALGSLALQRITSGYKNTAIGYNTGGNLTTGFSNVLIGMSVGNTITTGSGNIAIGENALNNSAPSGVGNVALGNSALNYATGNYGVAVGYSSGVYNSSSSNTFIGGLAGQGSANYSASGLTLIGYKAGYVLSTGANNNTLIGYQAGDSITTGANNLLIGYNVDTSSPTASNELNIGNAIYGNLSTGNVGIGKTSPQYTLDIGGSGNLNLTGTIFTAGTSGTSGQVLSSTGTGLAWVNASSVGGTYVFSNGLTNNGSFVGLGGTLTQDTNLTIGNTSVLFIKGTTGNVGLGTTNPQSALNVNGTLRLEGPTGYYGTISDVGGWLRLSSFGSGTVMTFSVGSTERMRLGAGLAIGTSFVDVTAPTNGMIVQGNVGIGTTAPSKKLDVVGDINLTGTIFSNGTSGTSGQVLSSTGTGLQWVNASSVGGTYVFSNGLTNNGTFVGLGGTLTQNTNLTIGNTSAFFINGTTGNIGIGTTNPLAALQIGYDTNNIASGIGLGGTSVGIFKAYGSLVLQSSLTGAVAINTNGIEGYTASNNFQISLASPNSTTATFIPNKADANTGIGWANNDILSLIAGGINGLNVNGSGNVGIGTTNPGALLHVAGTAYINTAVFTNQIAGYNNGGSINFNANNIDVQTSTDDYISLTTRPSGTLVEQVRITSLGNLGIGTTAPSKKLDVVGDINLTGTIFSNGTSGTSGQILSSTGTGLSWIDASGVGTTKTYYAGTGLSLDVGNTFSLNLGSSNTWTALQTFSGSIAIGSTQLVTNLNADLLDGYHASDFVSVGTTGSFLYTSSNGITQVGNDFRLGGALTTNTRLNIGNTEVMYFNTSGNVGIGTTNPREKLEIQGNLSFDDLTTGQIGTISSRTPATNRGSLDFYARGNSGSLVNVMTITGNLGAGFGAVGIGTTSPSNKLSINGSFDVTGNLMIGTTNPLGSDGFAENSVLSIVAPTAGGTGRERLLFAKVADSNNYFSVINTTSSNGLFIPTFVGYAADSDATRQAVSFDGRIAAGSDTASGIPAISFRAQQLDGSTAVTNRPIVGFGSGPSGNTYQMVVMSGGNVGIGTTAPSKKLDVVGDINLTGTIFSNGTSGTSGQVLSSTGTGLQWVNASSVGGTYTATNGLTLTGSNFKLGGELVESTRLNIGSTEVIYFNTSGNVGIGNTSPGTFKLNVTGNIVANNTGDGGKLSSTRNGSYEIYLQTSNQQTSRLHTQYGFWIEDASADRLFSYDTSITQPIISLNENNRNYDTWIKGNSNTLFYGDASTGNVGIGTTAPSKKLDVAGDINLTGTIFSNGTSGTSGQVLSSTGTGLQWVNATGLGQTYSADNGLHMTGNVVGLGGSLNGNTNIDTSGFNLNIGQGNTQALFISNGGNVGIGTTAPGTKLDVSGIFRTSGLPFASQVFPTTGVGFEMRYQTDYDALANLNTGGSGASVFQSFDRSGGAWKDLVVKGNNVVLSANGGSLILNGGNVGIGTTAPSKKLDVVGDINLTGTIFSNGTSGTSGQVLTSTGTGLQWVNASSVGQTYSVTNGLTMSSNVISLGGTLTQNTNLTVGNTSVLFLGTNGNVGIGTTSPTSKLHINGDLSFDGASGGAAAYLRDTGSTALRLGSTNTSRKVQMELYHAVNPVSLGVSYNAGAAEAYIESVHASYDNNTNLIFKPGGTEIWRVAVKGSGATTPYSFNITPTSNNYDFQLTNSSSIPLLRMDTSTGNLGIGTTAPSKKLDVVGDINLTGTIFSNGTSGTSGQILSSTGTGLSWIDASGVGTTKTYYAGTGLSLDVGNTFSLNLGSSNTWTALQTFSGSIAIGSTQLVTNLNADLLDGYHASDFVSVGTTGSFLYTASNGITQVGNDFRLGGALTTNTRLNIGNTEVMYFNTSGNVGIGTTNPGEKLAVNGNLYASSYIAAGTYIQTNTYFANISGTQDYLANIIGNYSSTSDLTVKPRGAGYNLLLNPTSGNVGIGTTAPSKKLDVVGDINLTGTIFSNGTSGTSGQVLSSTGTGLQWVNASSVGQTYSVTNGLTMSSNVISLGGTLTQNTRFNFGSTEVLYLNTSGNVGIGTTDISRKFVVQGTSQINGDTWINGFLAVGSNQDVGFTRFGSQGLSIKVGDTINSVVITASGNVGIGNTNPIGRLQIAGVDGTPAITTFSNDNSAITSQIRGDYGNNYAGYYTGTGGSAGYTFDYSGNIRLGDGGGTRAWMTINTTNHTVGIGSSRSDLGTVPLFITNSGNIGLGTTNPTQKLDINGSLNIGGSMSIGSTQLVTNLNSDLLDGFHASDFVAVGTTGSFLYTAGTGLTLSNTNVFSLDLASANTWTAIQNLSAGATISNLSVGGTIFTSNLFTAGNLGIGTTAPSKKLDVAGDINLTGTIFSNGTSGTSGQVLSSTGTGLQWVDVAGIGGTYTATNGLTLAGSAFGLGGTLTQNTNLTIGNTSVLFLGTNGNVGVGTTNPTYKIDVNGGLQVGVHSGWESLRITHTGTSGGGYFVQRTGGSYTPYVAVSAWDTGSAKNLYIGGGGWGVAAATHLRFYTANSYGSGDVQRMTIDNAGNVGINNLTPVSRLHVVGTGSSHIAIFDGSGNVGIGTTNPSKKLDVVGDINLTGTIFTAGTSGTSGQVLSSTGTGLQWVNASSVGGTYTFSNGLTNTGTFVGLGGTLVQNTNLTIGNTSILFLGTDGNIGIGTTSPTAKLQVNGDLRLTGSFIDSTNSAGTDGMILKSTSTGIGWTDVYDAFTKRYTTTVTNFSTSPYVRIGRIAEDADYKDVIVQVKATTGSGTVTDTTLNISMAYNVGNTASVGPSITAQTSHSYNSDTTNENGYVIRYARISRSGGYWYLDVQKYVSNTLTIVTSPKVANNWEWFTGDISTDVAAGSNSTAVHLQQGLKGSYVYANYADNAQVSAYGSYGGFSLSNGTVKTDQWEYIGNIYLAYNSTYRFGHSWNIELNINELSNNSDKAYNQFNNGKLILKGFMPTVADATAFNSTIPDFSVELRGNTPDLAEDDIAMRIDSTSTTVKYIRLYVRLKNQNTHYVFAPINRFGASYSSTGAISNSYVYYNYANGQTALASLPAAAQGSIVYATRGYDNSDYWRPNGNNVYNYNSGNIGIGTTAPSKKLDVAGDINLTGTIFATGTSGTSGQILSSTGTGLQWINPSSIGSTYSASNGLTLTGSTFSLGGTLTQNVRLNIGNTESLFIRHPLGNVGIGMTAPFNKLTVTGTQSNVTLTRTISLSDVGTTAVTAIGSTFTNDDSGRMLVWSNGTTRNIVGVNSTSSQIAYINTAASIGATQSVSVYIPNFYVSDNGRVGINTTDNTAQLTVNGDIVASKFASIYDYSRYYLSPGNASSNTAALSLHGNGSMVFNTETIGGTQVVISASSSTRLKSFVNGFGIATNIGSTAVGAHITWSDSFFVKNNGNVGIGTTDPQARLDIGGTSSTISNTSGDITLNSASNNISFSGDNLINITNGYFSGNVGIGVTNTSSNLEIGTTNSKLTLSTPTTSLAKNTLIGHISGRSTYYNSDVAGIKFEADGTYAGGIYPSRITFFTSANSAGAINLERMRIQENGYVGIGTTAPFTTLDVQKAISGGSPASTGTTDPNVISRFRSTGNTVLDFGMLANGDSWLQPRNPTNFSGNYNLLLSPNGGNIGIGITSPGQLLTIGNAANKSGLNIRSGTDNNGLYLTSDGAGQAIISGGAEFTGSLITDANAWTSRASAGASSIRMTGGQVQFFTDGSTGVGSTYTPTQRMVIDGNGNVGMGTTSPTSKLDVQGTIEGGENNFTISGGDVSNPYIDLAVGTTASGNTYNRGIILRQAKDSIYNWVNLGMYSNTGFGIGVNTTNQLNLSSSGNVGIGTTSPSVKLHVNGSTTYSVTGPFSGANANNSWGTGFSTQNVSVSILASGAVVGNGIFSASDERLKENIQSLNPTMVEDFLNNITPVSFVWSENNSYDTGFIAQDLMRNGFGYMVSGTPNPNLPERIDNDGFIHQAGIQYSVKYDAIVPILTMATKNLYTQFNQSNLNTAVLSQKLDGLSLTTEGQVNVNYNISENVLASLGYVDSKNEIESAIYSHKINTGLVKTINLIAQNIIAEVIKSKVTKTDTILPLDDVTDTIAVGGTLVTEELRSDKLTSQEATISTLYANRIISQEGDFGQVMTDKITSLREEIRNVIASIGSTSSIQESTQSAILAEAQGWSYDIGTSQMIITGDMSLSNNLVVGSKLIVVGDTQLGNAFITGTFTAGEIAIKDNFIETTNTALYIQPSGIGSVNIMNNSLVIAENGEVTLNGNLAVSGNVGVSGSLFATLINADEINTKKINVATDSATVVVASAETGFAALATSSAQIDSNATAGIATLPAGKTELVINNNKITSSSIIYLTPAGSTNNQVVYLKSKTIANGPTEATESASPSQSNFTIAIDQALIQDIDINWWIIN